MTADTPGTSSDPELGGEGDNDQLDREDTLVDRGIDDNLDEGYSVPDRPRSNHYGETAWEEEHRETIDQRTSQEEPETWEERETYDSSRDTTRTGRLVEDDDAVGAGGTDEFASDAGISGGAASAEEGAVHFVEEEYVDEDDEDEDS